MSGMITEIAKLSIEKQFNLIAKEYDEKRKLYFVLTIFMKVQRNLLHPIFQHQADEMLEVA